jgi:hypothetical protein
LVRQCLIDADVLCYEIGFAAETAWKHASPNSDDPPPWDFVQELLHRRIADIEFACEATLPSIFFLTGNGNFRYELAKRTPYKERAGHKPFHYKNIKAYIKGVFEYRETDGLEADDLMSIEQTVRGDETIICTRDKDLRSVDGWHFGWELGNQPSFGPLRVDGYGAIFLSDDRKKVTGYGLKFFLAQCLTGDSVDSVPGLPKCGPVAAFNILANTNTYLEGKTAVQEAYNERYGNAWDIELEEQGRLLWMTRKLNEDGTPVLWDVHATY